MSDAISASGRAYMCSHERKERVHFSYLHTGKCTTFFGRAVFLSALECISERILWVFTCVRNLIAVPTPIVR